MPAALSIEAASIDDRPGGSTIEAASIVIEAPPDEHQATQGHPQKPKRALGEGRKAVNNREVLFV